MPMKEAELKTRAVRSFLTRKASKLIVKPQFLVMMDKRPPIVGRLQRQGKKLASSIASMEFMDSIRDEDIVQKLEMKLDAKKSTNPNSKEKRLRQL